MITKEENERLTRVGPGTPMGDYLRRYWMPIAGAAEFEEFDRLLAPIAARRRSDLLELRKPLFCCRGYAFVRFKHPDLLLALFELYREHVALLEFSIVRKRIQILLVAP